MKRETREDILALAAYAAGVTAAIVTILAFLALVGVDVTAPLF